MAATTTMLGTLSAKALAQTAYASGQPDPFNWPMPKRQDLMSLSTINPDTDLVRAKTAQASQRMRSTSQNLDTEDIRGKY